MVRSTMQTPLDYALPIIQVSGQKVRYLTIKFVASRRPLICGGQTSGLDGL